MLQYMDRNESCGHPNGSAGLASGRRSSALWPENPAPHRVNSFSPP